MRRFILQNIIGKMVKANKEFKLIENGDVIAVGVSGGKDSLVLLEGLCRLKKFLKYDISIIAITVDMGLDSSVQYDVVYNICSRYDVCYIVEKTNIGNLIFNVRKEARPCSLCSKMRKGVINSIAKKKGCNKVAFGHNFDDVIETFIMNLFAEGRIACFSPITYFSDNDLYLIRPLVFAPEYCIKKALKSLNLTAIKNSCPADGNTYRQVIKNFLTQQQLKDSGFKCRIFTALRSSGVNGWGR